MATLQDAKRIARQVRQRSQSAELIEADLVAVANDDGVTSVKVTDTDTRNLVWAKLRGQASEPVQAYNGRVQPRNQLPVWVRRLADGTYEIEGVRSRDGSDFLGEALGSMNVPELIGELLSFVWPARNLKPGRARLSELGGMNLSIEKFYYSGGAYPGGTVNLTSYVPSVSGTQVWAKVYYDPISNALGVTTSSSYSLAYSLTETELDAVAISPNAVPLVGVLLVYGDTTISAATSIKAIQNWIDAPISTETFFPIHITDTRTIPSNRQIVIDRNFVDTGGILIVDGILKVAA